MISRLPTPTVPELLQERFLQCHTECVWLLISLWRLHEQREYMRHTWSRTETQDAADEREEFSIELTNFHALLANPHQKSVDVLRIVEASLRQYLELWPGSADAVDRWWTPRTDKHAAVHADLQLVIPGLWIGSVRTLAHEFTQLVVQKRIRHVVECKSTPIDTDDDFRNGAQRAMTTNAHEAAGGYPVMHTLPSERGVRLEHHGVTLFELGRMEWLIRRREKTIPASTTHHAIHKICQYLQPLLRKLRDDQYTRELVDHPCTTGGYVDCFDGMLLYCETGTAASIVVAVALLLVELRVPYDVALRLVTCARLYVAPSEFFEHALRAYAAFLAHGIPKI